MKQSFQGEHAESKSGGFSPKFDSVAKQLRNVSHQTFVVVELNQYLKVVGRIFLCRDVCYKDFLSRCSEAKKELNVLITLLSVCQVMKLIIEHAKEFSALIQSVISLPSFI